MEINNPHFEGSDLSKKVLVLSPSFSSKGGVAEYCKTLFEEPEFDADFFFRGKRLQSSWIFSFGIIRLLNDYLCFIQLIRKKHYRVVHVNTSLGLLSFFRDAMFIYISRFFGLRILVFFHGWNKAFQVKVSRYFLFIVGASYLQAAHIMVLSSVVGQVLQEWGYTHTISKAAPVIRLPIAMSIGKPQATEVIKILFLSRIETAKGVFELLESFLNIASKYPVELHIAGVGSKYSQVKARIKEMNLTHVYMHGHVSGIEKEELFAQSHIFVLPSYTEGWPISVAEAMFWGLALVVTPVGGLPDSLSIEDNALFCEVQDTKLLTSQLEHLIKDSSLRAKMRVNNAAYAKAHFTPQVVARKIMSIYEKL